MECSNENVHDNVLEINVVKSYSDREQLRVERKLRKKLKKEKEHQKRAEFKLQKLRPVYQGVSIVSEDVKNSIVKSSIECKCRQQERDLQNQFFPELGNNCVTKKQNIAPTHLKKCPLHSESNDLEINNKSKQRSKQPLKIDVTQVINKIGTSPIEKKVEPKSNEFQLSGNDLDSDCPQRKSGKHYENRKKISVIKKAIIKERHELNCNTAQNATSKEDYIDNNISAELNEYIKSFLTDSVYYQNRLYKQDPFKGIQKKRYVTGFHEVTKFLNTAKLKLIIIAPNIQNLDVLNIKIKTIIDMAQVHNVPYVFASSRRILGKIFLKFTPISCVGILNLSGVEDKFSHLMNLIQDSKQQFREQQNPNKEIKELDEPTNYLLNTFMQLLKTE